MGASFTISCPDCDYKTMFRLGMGEEGTGGGQVSEAQAEVKAEHPNHDGKSWKFLQASGNKS